jgi:branched-chain amino acid transport system permease protein
MLYFLQQLANGLHMGAVYALLAFGYALTNGVLHRTNLAFGALFGFAGQMTILIAVFGWQVLWLTLPATLVLGVAGAALFGALASAVLSRSVLAPLRLRAPNTVAAATLGVSLVLMELGRIAADTRDFWLPPLLSRAVVLASGNGFSVTLTVLQIGNCSVALIALAVGAFVVARTRYGRAWRAVSDDPLAAAFCGIDAGRVFFGAVLVGGLFASLAGILSALYFGNISFGTGLVFGLKVLFITAAGGYSAPLKAALGAACYGIGESLWSGYFPADWRDGWMLGLLVAMLVLRASPTDERASAQRV